MPADPFSTLLSTSKPGVFVNAMSGPTTGRGPHDLGEQGFALPAKRSKWSYRPKLRPAMGLMAITLGIVGLSLI